MNHYIELIHEIVNEITTEQDAKFIFRFIFLYLEKHHSSSSESETERS